jgi:hypothetical protein
MTITTLMKERLWKCSLIKECVLSMCETLNPISSLKKEKKNSNKKEGKKAN